ncbi:DUF4393 domain-containing protein [Burkholderia vietnamiensis]|uniref:DUF4393 domain-containing protein n=4 Tax=Pseudomonadati TaxID=3379134 RepID=UPI00264C7E0E|nr:DUF4393 domain-containing protein [Burkholderia vietnamiensis]MDN8115225.1 DUF4393 domain-containing protein [Burkholderia vietnamiensis]
MKPSLRMVDPVSTAKGGIEAVGALMKVAGDTPEVKEAGKNLGQAAVTLTKTINNALLPLAALNYGIEKARAYFAERFQSEMAAKAASIPTDEMVEPKSSVAGPALQGLAFTHEEPDLKAMYLSLLATAMDKRVSRSAHPAFVEIIRQIDAAEVPLLRPILLNPGLQPIVEIRQSLGPTGQFRTLQRHYVALSDVHTNDDVELPEFPAMIDNWVRLGLIEVSYDRYITEDRFYAWVENRKLYQELKATHDREGQSVIYQRGSMIRTAFGVQFARAVGMFDLSTPAPTAA